VWTCDNGELPPWKGDYHNDLNTQMTYLAYPAAGLFEQGMSWLNFNTRLLPQYRSFAKSFYGVDGAVVPGVMTISGKPMGGWGQYSLSPTHSAWVAQAFYLHWRYTRDDTFLREVAYPFCSAVGTALHALLKPDTEGHLRLPLSSSPEIFDNSYKAWLPPNSNYDLALMRFMFAANSEMEHELGPAPGPDRWARALAGLEQLDTDPGTGSLTFARGLPFNTSHRHFSHAMAIHPLGLLTIEGSDEDRRTIAATLDQVEKQGTAAWCGYSFSWFAAMNARAGRADKALEYLKKYERGFIGPNGFHLNGDQSGTGLSGFTYRPFTLEGNFLAMDAIQEMLLQSWGPIGQPGTVRVFPATPDAWSDVSFRDLRAEGALRVSADRKAGRTTLVRIAAERTGMVRLLDPFGGRPAVWSGFEPRKAGRVYEIEVPAGGTVEGRPADLAGESGAR
jgi:alpha-L-fucosidase 2